MPASAINPPGSGHAQQPEQKKRKGKPKLPDNESKEARFRRLATQRVNAAVKRIGYVGRLSNKSSYAYTPEQTDKIIKALSDAVAAVKARFTTGADIANGFML